MPPENASESTSAEEKEKLMRELKKRLAEIEDLKRQLGVGVTTDTPPDENDSRKRSEALNDAIEELIVPPLELLEDQPSPAKKKKVVDAPA